MTDDQVQCIFDGIRVERCSVEVAPDPTALIDLSIKDRSVQKQGGIKVARAPDPTAFKGLSFKGNLAQKPGGLLAAQEFEQTLPEDTLAFAGRVYKRNPSRVHKAAVLAQEHFMPRDRKTSERKAEPVPKRQKMDAESWSFTPEVLEKAPSNLQTVRGLMQFLEKKLEVAVPVAPEVGPGDLRARLHAYGDKIGRLSCLRANGGWDARAKRVLDISVVVATGAGTSVLEDADVILKNERVELEKIMLERGESTLEVCLEKRIAWAKTSLRQDYLWWCWRLLSAREASLTKALEHCSETRNSQARHQLQLSFIDIVQRLLNGERKGIIPHDTRAAESNRSPLLIVAPEESAEKPQEETKPDDVVQNVSKASDTEVKVCPKAAKDEQSINEDPAAMSIQDDVGEAAERPQEDTKPDDVKKDVSKLLDTEVKVCSKAANDEQSIVKDPAAMSMQVDAGEAAEKPREDIKPDDVKQDVSKVVDTEVKVCPKAAKVEDPAAMATPGNDI